MNKVILMGRLARDPDIRYTQGANGMLVARYTLAVDRRGRRDDNGQTADFISCVAFGKNAEFAEKYLYKGIKILITGRIQIGSYIKEEKRVYTTDIVVDTQEFAESKGAGQGSVQPAASTAAPPVTSTAAPAVSSTTAAAPAAQVTTAAAPAVSSTSAAAPAAQSTFTAAPAAQATSAAAPAAQATSAAAPAAQATSTAAPAATSTFTAAPSAPATSTAAPAEGSAGSESDFMNIPDGIEEELPFR